MNAHHCRDEIWVGVDGKGGWKVPSGKGQRLIVVHAGGVEGWVVGADLVFRSKTNSADYHDEMNSEHIFLVYNTASTQHTTRLYHHCGQCNIPQQTKRQAPNHCKQTLKSG